MNRFNMPGYIPTSFIYNTRYSVSYNLYICHVFSQRYYKICIKMVKELIREIFSK